jgi:hypothetical protein
VVCRQKIVLGRVHAAQTITIALSDTTLAIELDDAEPASCAAPPPTQSVTSKPTGRGRSPQFPRVNDKHHLAGNVQPHLAQDRLQTRLSSGD